MDVEALRLVEVLAFGLAAFSFFAAGAFLVVVVLALVVEAFLGTAAFSFLGAFGLVSELFWECVSSDRGLDSINLSESRTLVAEASLGGEAFLGAASFLASFTGPEAPTWISNISTGNTLMQHILFNVVQTQVADQDRRSLDHGRYKIVARGPSANRDHLGSTYPWAERSHPSRHQCGAPC